MNIFILCLDAHFHLVAGGLSAARSVSILIKFSFFHELKKTKVTASGKRIALAEETLTPRVCMFHINSSVEVVSPPQRFFHVNFLRAPSCPGFFLSLTLGSGVSRPAGGSHLEDEIMRQRAPAAKGGTMYALLWEMNTYQN